MVVAARLKRNTSRTYCMLGDGEIQEGQIWEAAMSGAFHKMDNVVAIVDYNGIQLDGFVKDIMEVAPLADKWRAFGWHTVEIDGHDFPAIQGALREADATKGKPTFFFSSRRRHTSFDCDWSSDVCSSDLDARARVGVAAGLAPLHGRPRRHRRRHAAATLRLGAAGDAAEVVAAALRPRRGVRELGRASCREREHVA